MKKILLVLVAVLLSVFFSGCSENYANGERIGLVTQFSQAGLIFKSWEGHLNMTQTGMNSSTPFDFSIDNNKEPDGLVAKIDSAAKYGWKVKLVYHEVCGTNLTGSRGETNHCVTECEVLDKNPVASAFGKQTTQSPTSGRVVDTIYLVIYRDKK